jgi:TPR repeat protein
MRRSSAVGALIVFIASAVFSAVPVSAQNPLSRVALIITNQSYRGVPPLDNPIRDGALISNSLKTAGFETIIAHPDVDKASFDSALRDFKRKADVADVALVYYAGHGIELDGENWLLPVDARLEDPADVLVEGVALQTLMHFLRGARKLRIVILDACRDNPFAMRLASTRGFKRGLTPVEGLIRGTIVAYSASAGQAAADGEPGENSPFAKALANRLVEPGLEVRFMFAHVRDDVLSQVPTQEPWIGTSLSAEEIVFVQPTSRRGEEAAAFTAAAKRWTVAAWSEFLKRYPDGEYRLPAQQALASLKPTAPPIKWAMRAVEDPVSKARAALHALDPEELNVQEGAVLVAKVLAASSREGIIRLAADGDARAQFLAARAYYTGQSGFPVDHVEAVRLLKLASASGLPAAHSSLGLMYDNGFGGLPSDKVEAVRLYKLAAAGGNARGQVNLGVMYSTGSGGLMRDPTEAARLYSLAAARGSPAGQGNLGSLYYNGRGGLPKDEKQAERLFRLAAANGEAGAQANLGMMYEEGRASLGKNIEEAVRLYKLSAEQGNSAGQANLASAYEKGIGGVKKDLAEAIRLYRLAARQDSLWAQAQLKRLGRQW